MAQTQFTIRSPDLERLMERLVKTPKEMLGYLERGLNRSLDYIETESARRTPVDTGRLRASIGSQTDGFKFVRVRQGHFSAGVGTNVKYAPYVHKGHKTQSKYMERGFRAAVPNVNSELQAVADKTARFIANK